MIIVSVLTPTVPGREHFLRECVASVKAQTLDGVEHIVQLDKDWNGCSATVNAAAARAVGEWVFILGDDDILLPLCLEIHYQAVLESGADIVYAPPLVWGEPHDQFRKTPPNIPAVSLIRRSLWDRLGGYGLGFKETEDRDLYQRAMQAGAKFHRADKHPTWIYRFHGGNKSRGHLRRPSDQG